MSGSSARPQPAATPAGAAPPGANPAAEQVRSLEDLAGHLARLEVLHDQMARAELERLGELATLMRIAEALTCRRSFDEVLADCLDEVTRIVGHDEVWVVESQHDRPVAKVHHLNRGGDAGVSPPPLPRAVRSLCQRVFANRPHQCLVVADHRTGEGGGDYFGMPIFTAKHLVGTLAARDDGHRVAGDPNKVQLIQSILRQAAMAAENDRLIHAMTQMIVEVVVAFSLAIESRDPYTGGHVQRVTAYGVLLARHIGLDAQQQAIVRLGGLLHDIGKVAVPDHVLNKPGKLTAEEFALIRTHPVVGHQIIGQIPQLQSVHALIRHHHERWDGKGYPDGLAGQDIPLLARVLAIADTFDAMTSSRSYRPAMSLKDAMTEIRRCAGTQFDAEMAASFALFEPRQLADACEEMRTWCRTTGDAGDDVIDLIDLRMPPMVRPRF